MKNIIKLQSLIILFLTIISMSYANNSFVKTDLQILQLQGPVKVSYTTYYNEHNKIDAVSTQLYDKDGFLYMSMIDAYNPDPIPHIYQWHQFYKNNQKKFFILLNNELLSFFPVLYPVDTELYRHAHLSWTDQGATADIILNNRELTDEKVLYQEKCFYDASDRIIRSEITVKNHTISQNIYYLSFIEYQNINLSDYELNDVIYITATKKEIKNYVEEHWQQLDPRIIIIYTRYVDQYGNPLIQYQYSSQNKQKITHSYLYY